MVPVENMTSRHLQSVKILATWFGCGLSPVMPGTVGTLGAIPLVYLFQRFGQMEYMYATFTFIVFSILVAQVYEVEIAKEHDQPELVIDEVAGFLVTMVWLPFTWQWVALGFVAFRFFDMLKPWPISWIDRRILGGLGAVADDLAAGVIASVILQYVYQHGYLGAMG
jgi:phosphatidylglycerophosphatase A